MHLDVLTLVFAGSLVALVGAMMLGGAWISMRRTSPALLWWTASYAAAAISLALIALGSVYRSIPLLLAGMAISVVGYALIWAGLRCFHHRKILGLPVLGAAASALSAFAVLAPVDPASAVKAAGFAATLYFLIASIWELWRGRADRFQARLGFKIILALHAFVFVGGLYEVLSGIFPVTELTPLDSWFGLINFEGLFFFMASAIVMLLLCKERIEEGHIAAALTDGITGVPTRAAFLDIATRLFDRSKREDAPFSLILFDLDLFKRINDTHGHRAGDRVLAVFAETCQRALRPNDLIGRYGGEEFVVVLPGTTVTTAYLIAERTRHAFAEARAIIDGRHIAATVSAGVAASVAAQSFDDLVEFADTALYRAKNNGRNNVQIAVENEDDEAANIIRIA